MVRFYIFEKKMDEWMSKVLIFTLAFASCKATLGLLEREQSRALPIQMDMGTDEAITICTGLKRFIACRDGANIAINNAFWGRISDKVCPSDDGDPVTDCEGSEDTLGIVKGYCESKNECQLEAKHEKLQKNGTHHCPGVNKYLIVNFTCIPESRGATLCDSAETMLSCPSTWTMELADVFWGRRANSRYCGAENSMECDSSEYASKYLKSLCNGKKKCNIKAESSVLDNAHSPCAGMLKYLMVNYICRPPSTKYAEENDDEDSKILSDTSSKELMGLLEKHLNEIKAPDTAISPKEVGKPVNVVPTPAEEKKPEVKQAYTKSKTATSKARTRNNVGKTSAPSFIANEEDDLASSLLNGPAFARTVKKQDVAGIKKEEGSNAAAAGGHRKDEIYDSVDTKEASGTKTDESFDVAEPNTVRSILARAKEVLKTLDGDNPTSSNLINEELNEDILNKRGGIARSANDTSSAVKQVAKLAQSLVNAEKSAVVKSDRKKGSSKIKELGVAAIAKPKPGSTRKLGYRAGTGSAGIGNTP